jgi:uncharacterized protein (TIGR02118 family)
MSFCYFVHFRAPGGASVVLEPRALDVCAQIIAEVRGVSRALLHTPIPGGAAHAFPNDEAPPSLAVQVYADRIESLEEALRPEGRLQALISRDTATGLHALKVQQQLMLVRRLAIVWPDPSPHPPERSCSYLVHYPGQAADLSAWHRHYIDHHPPIMRKFSGVREIEICTRLDWMGGLPGMRVEFMQRNKLMFDTPAELSAALSSPIIGEMRADFHNFPDFAGGNVHYPMLTREIAL